MQFYYTLCLIVNLIGLGFAFQTEIGCPRLAYSSNLKVYNGKCYQFVPIERNWYDAKDYCEKFGGQLVTIPNSETNEFLKSGINSLWWRNNGIWIGLNDLDVDGQFTWTSKSTANKNTKLGSWTNWGSGHPGAFLSSRRDCIKMVRDGGAWKWHESFCNFLQFQYRFICQYETVQPVMTSTTIKVESETVQPVLSNTAISVESETTHLLLQPTSSSHGYAGNDLIDPVAHFQQGEDLRVENSLQDGTKTSIILLSLTFLLILGLVFAVLLYRRRYLQTKKQVILKNKYLEDVSNEKVENIYIDENMQKFLKINAIDKQESIYEEIPYDSVMTKVVKV